MLEVQQILKMDCSSGITNLTIEYDVSVIQTIEFSLSPLLIEIERPMNDSLGIMLTNHIKPQRNYDFTYNAAEVPPVGIYISNILPASIADR